jgi:methyl-accepting chemotaxis protein
MEDVHKLSYLRKTFYLTHAIGLAVGLLFPLPASLIIGPVAFTFPFISSCLLTGFAMAAIMFLLIRTILKKQLKQQLALLRPLIGEISVKKDSVENLTEAISTSVITINSLVRQLLATTDKFVPHYRALAEVSHFLSERAKEGMTAASQASLNMQSMEEKQQQVIAQVQALTEKAQEEATWSKELSASLLEMSGTMEHSTAKFLETTATVDQMAASIREVVAQADEVTRSVEGTAYDLDAIGDSLAKIQSGAVASAQSASTVKEDAENGLRVMQTSMEEMTRIEQESRKATDAMRRLSQQTKEVAKIIKVIKELVSDTELLAFNAAIIAAKAGEEGKGFSVVAEEIRDLADRTTTSAQDIQQIVTAIGGDTREVTAAVEATAKAISKGKELSHSTGEALRKIVESSSEAAASSDEIADLTEQQGRRARALLNDAGHSLQSVKAINRIIQEQKIAISCTQEGVTQMKAAADRIACGMTEQVTANQMFDQGLAKRESQVQSINEATRHQMTTANKVLQHFAKSEQRLQGNAQKAAIIGKETVELETLASQLKELAAAFSCPDRD